MCVGGGGLGGGGVRVQWEWVCGPSSKKHICYKMKGQMKKICTFYFTLYQYKYSFQLCS